MVIACRPRASDQRSDHTVHCHHRPPSTVHRHQRHRRCPSQPSPPPPPLSIAATVHRPPSPSPQPPPPSPQPQPSHRHHRRLRRRHRHRHRSHRRRHHHRRPMSVDRVSASDSCKPPRKAFQSGPDAANGDVGGGRRSFHDQSRRGVGLRALTERPKSLPDVSGRYPAGR